MKQRDTGECKWIKALRWFSREIEAIQPAFAISAFNLFNQLLSSICKWLGAKAGWKFLVEERASFLDWAKKFRSQRNKSYGWVKDRVGNLNGTHILHTWGERWGGENRHIHRFQWGGDTGREGRCLTQTCQPRNAGPNHEALIGCLDWLMSQPDRDVTRNH